MYSLNIYLLFFQFDIEEIQKQKMKGILIFEYITSFGPWKSTVEMEDHLLNEMLYVAAFRASDKQLPVMSITFWVVTFLQDSLMSKF